MNVLVLGVGLQGRAAVADLANSAEVESVIAADADDEGPARFLDRLRPEKVRGVTVDAADEGQVRALMAESDAVVHLLAPQLQYGPGERDVAYVAVEAKGVRAGRPHGVRYQALDFRDLETGLLAMRRTVGFTASIGAQMLLRDEIPARGLLSPLTDVPAEPFFAALRRRGIGIERVVEA